jgi:ribosome-binding factor A
VSVLGDERVRAESLEGLRSAHGFLQSRVATELRLKHTPTLTFQYDESVDRGMRVTGLIESVARSESGPRATAAGGDEDGDRSGDGDDD